MRYPQCPVKMGDLEILDCAFVGGYEDAFPLTKDTEQHFFLVL